MTTREVFCSWMALAYVTSELDLQLNIRHARLMRGVVAHKAAHPFAGHAGPVLAVAVTPDGEETISGGADGPVRVWDRESRALLNTLSGHVGPVRSIAIATDGTYFASAGDDGIVRVWDHATKALTRSLIGHTEAVYAITVNHTAEIISGSFDGTVRVWNPFRATALVATMTGHSARVRTVTTTSDSEQIISGADDASIRVWDPHAGKVAALEHCSTLRCRETSSLLDPRPGSEVVSRSKIHGDEQRLTSVRGRSVTSA